MSDELPQGWATAPLSDLLISLESGSRPHCGVRSISEGIPSIGGEHVKYDGSFNFSSIKGAYQEKDLESAILREMESFILELGTGFAFLERQKRITLDGEDFYLDLLFYHRGLNRLVIIELKLEKFKPAYKGQMEMYLRWLEKYEKKPNEKSPIGLILCAGKSDEQIELLELSKSGIRVAEYMTELLPRKALEKKLHQAIKLARSRLKPENKKEIN